jgi:hypothetical protein
MPPGRHGLGGASTRSPGAMRANDAKRVNDLGGADRGAPLLAQRERTTRASFGPNVLRWAVIRKNIAVMGYGLSCEDCTRAKRGNSRMANGPEDGPES